MLVQDLLLLSTGPLAILATPSFTSKIYINKLKMFDSDIPVEQEVNEIVSFFKPKFRSIHKTVQDDELSENTRNT
jgi:hypothetical protein